MNAWDDLSWRGLIHQHTPGAKDALASPTGVFCGFDPTARSLHVGNLVGLLTLRRLRAAGHQAVAVLGDATAMIGDPSGKAGERDLMDRGAVDENSRLILRQVIDIAQPTEIRHNSAWIKDVNIVDFLRDVGKHFPVNEMMRRRAVELRRDGGMSFAELAYVLVQALDFAVLSRHGVKVQVGGSDQWGNITAGIDLARRRHGADLHGLTWPLLTGQDGAKFGKTERGAVWLDPSMTSPFEFFQFWRNRPDSEVGTMLRWFTFLSEDEIKAVEGRPGEAQRVLARSVTAIVHGEGAALDAAARADALFGGDVSIIEPGATIQAGAIALDAMMATGMWASRGEARRDIKQGGATMNGAKVEAHDQPIQAIDGRVLVGRGKRRKFVLRVEG